jgi:hypothetical protein
VNSQSPAERVAEIKAAFDTLAYYIVVLGAATMGQETEDAVPETSGVKGKELLRFAGAISAEDLDAMEKSIEEGCERVVPGEW